MMYGMSRFEPVEPSPDFCCQKCGEELTGFDHVYSYQGVLYCAECYMKEVLSREAYENKFVDSDTADALAEILMDDVFTAEEAKEMTVSV